MENLPNVQSRLSASARDPRLLKAALALTDNRKDDAESLLREHLEIQADDIAALRMLADLIAPSGKTHEAETLLRRALRIEPHFGAAYASLAAVLLQTNRLTEALTALDALMSNPLTGTELLRAAIYSGLGRYDEAVQLYKAEIERLPRMPGLWLSYGHVLRTMGRLVDSVAAYRRAIEIRPAFGEAWWGLANLKTVRFSANDLDAMTGLLAHPNLTEEDRYHLEFALGKCHEDLRDSEKAFAYYQAANRRRRTDAPYDKSELSAHAERAIATFTPSYFEARQGQGCTSQDPIFVVGLPRSGSTLVEQILSSHSMVEGVTEFQEIMQLWQSFGKEACAKLAGLSHEELIPLGDYYLERTSLQRKTKRAYFVDKQPNNWQHIGFIKTIFPHAKIVDVRRHPLSCGFSNYKQHYATGMVFSNDLTDIGHFYTSYVRLMAHFDATLPGQIHRVTYERLVEDSETEIRALLGALNLPFEDACLAFHKTERAVRTPSSEQVRAPIFRSGTENWQPFEPWLLPLKEVLGTVLTSYPDVPRGIENLTTAHPSPE